MILICITIIYAAVVVGIELPPWFASALDSVAASEPALLDQFVVAVAEEK